MIVIETEKVIKEVVLKRVHIMKIMKRKIKDLKKIIVLLIKVKEIII